jgi:hypothetical protein
MKLSEKYLTLLFNLLLGSAWAFVVVGALSALFHNGRIGWLYAFASAFLWALPGLFAVVVIEYLLRGFERNEEIRRQTALLEEIREELRKAGRS